MSLLYFEKYLKMKLDRGLSPRTLETEKRHFIYFMDFLTDCGFEGTETDVAMEDFQAYAKWVNERPIKANTKHARLGPIPLFYKEAVRQGWMPVDPCKGFERPKREQVIPKVLTVKEMKRLLVFPKLSSIKGVRDRMIMELLYSSALRLSEIVEITPDSFMEDYRSIRIIGKGNKEAIIPVGRMAAHFVKFYIENIWKAKAKTDKLLFNTKTFEAMTKDGLRVNLGLIGRQANLKIGLSAHVFRYSIATHLSNEGADIRLIQEFMRHESIDTTARYIGYGLKELRKIHSKTHPLEAGS